MVILVKWGLFSSRLQPPAAPSLLRVTPNCFLWPKGLGNLQLWNQSLPQLGRYLLFLLEADIFEQGPK